MNVDSVPVLAGHRGKLLFVFGALLALAATLAGLKHWRRVGEPRVHFARTEVDFGKIPSGGSFTCEFRFRNRSSKPITIARVRSSCGCLAEDSPEQPIPDGGTGSLGVILSTKGIRPPKTLTKRLLVVFEQPGVEPVALIVRARVCPDVSCEPEALVFKEPSPDGKASADLMIRREMLPPDEFASILVEAPHSYYRIEDLGGTKDEHRVHVELMSERAPRDPSPLRVRYCKSGQQTHLIVPVVFLPQHHAELVPPAYVKVARSSSSPTELAETTTTEFVVTSPASARLRVLEIVPEKPEEGRFFRWRIHRETPSFDIWLSECPPTRDAVYSTALLVLVSNSGESQQHLRLDAHVVVTATE